MELDTQLKLGQSTSLLNGYKADIYSVPFTDPSKPALYLQQPFIEKPNLDAKWSFPIISFHENAEDLLSAVFQVRLRNKSSGRNHGEVGKSAIWPGGALVLAGLSDATRKKALLHLSDQIGINLSNNDWSYALVRRNRIVGAINHTCFEKGIFKNPDPEKIVKPDALATLKTLEKLQQGSTDVSMSGANGYLKFYDTFGSHFVSSITAGDSIFQVFAFASAEYQNVVKIYAEHPEDLSGPASFSFAVFTTPRKESGYGYTASIGKICIKSGDPQMTKSLEAGLWLEKTYSNTNSILAPFLRTNAVNVNITFKKIVAMSIELYSLAAFAEYYRMLIWELVFKGAMFAKYGSGPGVAPYFSNNCPYDLNSIFKDSDPIGDDGLLSTLATPTVSICQEKIDLSRIVLQFPELVKEFRVFASGIQIPSPASPDKAVINIPGLDTATIIGHVITSGGTGPLPPDLRLSETAYTKVKERIFCGEFYGSLHISGISNSKGFVIMNGLIIEECEGKVSVMRDVRKSPAEAVLTERLTDVQFAVVAAEARLNFLLADTTLQTQVVDLVKRFLLWLAGVSGSRNQCQDDQLAALRARAMYLATVASKDQKIGVTVPYLKYEAHKDVVNNVQNVLQTVAEKLADYQNQIRARKAEERQIDRESALNENIINSGILLESYITAQADYQQSLEDIYSSILTDKVGELDKASKQAQKLSSSLSEQRNVVKEAIIKYEDAVADWYEQETIRAAIDIASNLFALGFSFISPATSFTALKNLEDVTQKIQEVVEVFNAIIEAYRSIQDLPSNPQKVIDVLKSVGPSGLDMPSALEWDEMKVNFEEVLSLGPDVTEKNSLYAAFSVLVIRGKALLQCQNTVRKIATDLSSAQQRVKLHQDQTKRLADLKLDLKAKPQDLDVTKIDLIGLSGQLLFFERQMLMILTSTVVMQDRALQYEYLRPPTTIRSFTLLNLQLALLTQSQSINEGLTIDPFPTDQERPIIFEIHGVKPESIIDNQRFTFNINLNKPEFASFNYVRVKNVEVEIDGIISTKSGNYYTELVFDGNPFFDRGFDGQPLTFNTISRTFTGLHDCPGGHDSGKRLEAYLTATGQDAFGDKISCITPFSTWDISLPKSISNEHIKFVDHSMGVTIRLIFHIYAQLKETHDSKDFVPTEYSAPNTTSVFMPTSSSRSSNISPNDVLKMMSGKSVCAGWDVVFSMTAEQVNNQLNAQYKDRTGNPNFLRQAADSVIQVTSEGHKSKTHFNLTFDAPKLQFLLNNSNSAQIFLPIKSGHYKYSLYFDNKWNVWEEADVKETDKSYVQGNVPLAILPGSVSFRHNVSIKLNGGSFSAKDFKAGVSNPMFAIVLTDYFTNLKDGYEVYNLGTLDFTGITTLESLIPTSFKINIFRTQSNRDLLQLFIATTGNLQSATSLYLREPIPTAYESSLIINSKIFFKDILPTSLNEYDIGLALKAIEPVGNSNCDKVWSAKAISGCVSSPFPTTMVSSWLANFEGATITMKEFVKVPNNTVLVDLKGMDFLSGDEASSWDTKMSFDSGARQYPFQFGSCSSLSPFVVYRDSCLDVTVDMKTTLPVVVKCSGQNQLVIIDGTSSLVTIDGNLSPPGGFCHASDREIQKIFLDLLNENVPGKLTKAFNKPFTAVSLFALKNLLFPAKNFINMEEAFVPGDMIIFGNFTSTD